MTTKMPPKKPIPTHFLCIPLVTAHSRPQLAASLSAFRSDVTSPVPLGFGLADDAIRPLGTLHLTLGIFSFPRGGDHQEGEAQLARAREVLAGLELREIWKGVRRRGMPRMPGSEADLRKGEGQGRVEGTEGTEGTKGKGEGEEEEERPKITLRGLASMQAPTQAAVLYAPPVDQLGLLQAFCERVRDVFREAELMVDEGRPLLLHATVVNTVYVKNKKEWNSGVAGNNSSSSSKRARGGRGGNKWDRLVFDATGIIDRYEDQVWMQDVPVEKVAICKMGAKKVVVDGQEDEAYEVEAEVEF
ncbi:kinase A anchor protein [Chaetomium strumarium]|uniref:Kinase A anchor protein n=1 Tax=Chaetomium strumarium TaxID=1170767 RepID=A0AAJ0GR63_9PEZI|nr:kinase A anchor protein [Chaetomium strumarium]